MKEGNNGQFHYPYFDTKLPFTFSLKARLIKRAIYCSESLELYY
jgi:hypothetical protein